MLVHSLPEADYYAFERIVHSPAQIASAGPWDIFLSAYDETMRVKYPFRRVSATHKQWLVHEEYGLKEEDCPMDSIRLSSSFDPPDLLDFVKSQSDMLSETKLCIDSTGFIRPHLLVLLRALRDIGVRKFDVLYSDPMRYIEDEDTDFTSGPVIAVEQIPGYEGLHRHSGTDNDVLVIGAGYNYEQIMRACEAKLNSRKYVLIGLPSLQPHMYQESVLKIDQANESLGPLSRQQRRYAPANHPFVVAQLLHDLLETEKTRNIYLCPVGPKPHVLGFAVYYLRELKDEPVSIIYPFVTRYSSRTSEGIRRTWQYRIEI